MTPEEIKQFKRVVAEPRMQEIFADTEIPKGTCYIDSLNIEFLDGRSYGVESVIEAHGVIAKAEGIEMYAFSAQDIGVADFVEEHRNCLFLSDGALRVFDQLNELEINAKMWNCARCEKVFEALTVMQELSFVSQDFIYLKMKAILSNDSLLQQEPAALLNQSKDATVKSTLSQQIHKAAERTAEKKTHVIQPERDDR